MSKGERVEIGPTQDEDLIANFNVFAPRPLGHGSQLRMGMLLLAGLVLMLLHHLLYLHLDGKPTESLPFVMHGFSILVSGQSVVSVIGGAIAYLARVVLSAAIGVAFVQVFWLKLRRRQYSVKQIDALVACKGEAFAFSALPAWHYAFLLAAIASMSSLMALISIVAPGSLKVTSSEISLPCTVQTVSLNTSDLALDLLGPHGTPTFNGTQSPLFKLAGRVLMAGAPLPPHNPCPDSCRYEVTFDAPVTNCTPVNSTFDFPSWLPPPFDNSSPYTVWNASSGYAGAHVTAASRNPANNSQSAAHCTSYKGTYTVEIVHSNATFSASRVVQVIQHEPTHSKSTVPDGVETQYDAITTAFANVLWGTIKIDPSFGGSINYYDNWLVGMSPSFSGNTKSSWSPTADLGTEISTFMQNISISLLSDELLEAGDSPTAPYRTVCKYPAFTYDYNQARLLAVYAAALGIAALCTSIGVRAMYLNGVEESFSFSRIVGAVLNGSLFNDRYALTRRSQLTANGIAGGHLRLVHSDYGEQELDNVFDKLIS